MNCSEECIHSGILTGNALIVAAHKIGKLSSISLILVSDGLLDENTATIDYPLIGLLQKLKRKQGTWFERYQSFAGYNRPN